MEYLYVHLLLFMEEKFIATMILHAVGDTIGFKNGEWEFFPDNKKIGPIGVTMEKLYEFIHLGGVANIDLSNWNVSDDTIFHMAIANALTIGGGALHNDLCDVTVSELVAAANLIDDDKKNNIDRAMGATTDKYTNRLKNGENWKNFAFDMYAGGNGAAMRSNCIGLAMFGEERRNNLIEYAIQSSKMTHNNPIGWLGGLVSALFTAFAIENIDIILWIPSLLNALIDHGVEKKFVTSDDERMEFNKFVYQWKTYYSSRFVDGKPIEIKSHTNLTQRIIFYNNLFENDAMGGRGMSGYSATIIAYDCLIDSGNKWDTLVFYSMINGFDSDTIGAIAGGLFGSMYGFHGVPKRNILHLEFKEKLINLGKLLYTKYF